MKAAGEEEREGREGNKSAPALPSLCSVLSTPPLLYRWYFQIPGRGILEQTVGASVTPGT